jgi:hypothetical protein
MGRFLMSILNTLPVRAKAGNVEYQFIMHMILLLPLQGEPFGVAPYPGCRSLRSLALGYELLPLRGALLPRNKCG